MTKKHYIAIAKVLCEMRNDWPDCQPIVQDIAQRLAQYFKSQNPSFDTPRFLAACKETNGKTIQQ